MSDNPYGVKGCNCTEEVGWDDRSVTWYPNAFCPNHGILAGYTPDRMDTGVYKVVVTGPKAEECPPGVHSAFDFCPGREVCEDGYGFEERGLPTGTDRVIEVPAEPMPFRDVEVESLPSCGTDAWYPAGPPGEPADGVYRFDGATTEKKETGVLATVRRGWLRLSLIWGRLTGWN